MFSTQWTISDSKTQPATRAQIARSGLVPIATCVCVVYGMSLTRLISFQSPIVRVKWNISGGPLIIVIRTWWWINHSVHSMRESSWYPKPSWNERTRGSRSKSWLSSTYKQLCGILMTGTWNGWRLSCTLTVKRCARTRVLCSHCKTKRYEQ